MIILNTPVKNATSNVTDQVVTIDIIYRIIGSLMDESIICNVCRTNHTIIIIIIIIIIQYTIRICLSGGFVRGGGLSGRFCPWGFVRGGFVRGGFVRGWGFFPGGGVVSWGFCQGDFV